MYTNGTVYMHLTPCFQVTTHSHLLSHNELNHVCDSLSLDQSHVHVFSLEEFDTELDFSNKVRYVNKMRCVNNMVHLPIRAQLYQVDPLISNHNCQ